ncbi:MAG: tRNA lysidine(34) synthetase TilS [Acidimicrobiia bacterium]|nr:tRNA lysidine(34) synthetase TilS [Acidimicrobiia bacterium]
MAGSRRLGVLAGRVLAQAPDPPVGRVAVALSGGADSAVAAWLMLEQGTSCRAVHVDHGLAGSPIVRAAAVAIAARLGLDLEVLEVTVPTGASPESQGREVRYAALEASCGEGEWLVTGHTSDDQAETVFLNILRGTGPTGLTGIPAQRGRLLRPILGVTRSETRELATLLGLPWRDDPSNRSLDPRRNQIRRDVLPDLEARFNPRLRASLVELAGSVADGIPTGSTSVQMLDLDEGIALAAPELHAIGPAAASHAIRDALRRVRGPYAGTRAEVMRVSEVASGVVSSAELAGGLKVFRRGPWLIMSPARHRDAPPPVEWSLPGAVSFGRWAFESWVDQRAPVAFPLSAWMAVADAAQLPDAMTVRVAEPADEVDGVSVGEVLRRLGVSPGQRSNWPVAVASGSVVWVPGARISRAVWVGSTTRRYLWVHAQWETV